MVDRSWKTPLRGTRLCPAVPRLSCGSFSAENKYFVLKMLLTNDMYVVQVSTFEARKAKRHTRQLVLAKLLKAKPAEDADDPR